MANPIKFYPGTHFRRTYKITDAKGQPIDISGDTLWLYLKEGEESDANAALKVAGDVSQGQQGIVIFDAPASLTTNIEPGVYHREIVWRPDGDADLERIALKDKFTVYSRVTEY